MSNCIQNFKTTDTCTLPERQTKIKVDTMTKNVWDLRISGWQIGRFQPFVMWYHTACFKRMCVLQDPASSSFFRVEMSSSTIFQVTGSFTSPVPVLPSLYHIPHKLVWVHYLSCHFLYHLSWSVQDRTRLRSLPLSDLSPVYQSSYHLMLHNLNTATAVKSIT